MKKYERVLKEKMLEKIHSNLEKYLEENVSILPKDKSKLSMWVYNEAQKFRDWAEDYAIKHSTTQKEYKELLKYLIHIFQAKLMSMIGIK